MWKKELMKERMYRYYRTGKRRENSMTQKID